MANIIMNVNKKSIEENAKKYDIVDIIGLCDKITGLMAYNETNEEYNFLVETVYPSIPYDKLPCRYLPKAAQIIKDALNTENVALARAQVYFNMSSMSLRNGDLKTYNKYRKMLEEMVRDHAISSEFIRDLDGMEACIDPAFPDGGIY